MTFVDIRQPVTGKLLFRYDPGRRILVHVDRGVKTVIDLAEYDAPDGAEKSAGERPAEGDDAAA